MSETKKPVINVADAPLQAIEPPGGSERFGAEFARLGPLIGARDLGVMYMETPPGKRAFPFHAHHANEEMFIVLEGEGTYRFGKAEHAIRAGDVCAAPTGGAETAHQIINTGSSTLRYLSLSTMRDPEVAEYPDSGMYGVYSYGCGDDEAQPPRLRQMLRVEDGRDYWEGET